MLQCYIYGLALVWVDTVKFFYMSGYHLVLCLCMLASIGVCMCGHACVLCMYVHLCVVCMHVHCIFSYIVM